MANPGPNYGKDHRARRAMMLPNALGTLCPICQRVMVAGQKLDLDHGNPAKGRGMAITHASCNQLDGAQLGNQRKAEADQRRREARRRRYVEAAVAVSGARDRQHVSIGVAATLEDEPYALIEVVWTKRHGVLTEILDELGLRTVAVDPTSIPSMPPPPGVQLYRPPVSEAQMAVPRLLDAVTAGRVRHVEHPRLAEAVRDSGKLGAELSPLRSAALAFQALKPG